MVGPKGGIEDISDVETAGNFCDVLEASETFILDDSVWLAPFNISGDSAVARAPVPPAPVLRTRFSRICERYIKRG